MAPALHLLLSSLALLAQGPEDFQKDLAQVERAMNQGRWEQASERLDKLLVEHERAEYLFPERDAILQHKQRIDLFLAHEPPGAEEVLAGEVKKYDPVSGKIDVVFQGRDLSDFYREDDIFTFPPTFSGPYSIEMTGNRYPTNSPLSIIIGWNTDHVWRVSYGNNKYMPHILWLREPESEMLVTSQKQPLKMGQEYQLLVEVKSNKVNAKANKKKLFTQKRAKNEYGRAAFFGMTDYDREEVEIRIKGEIEPSWIAGLIDEKMQDVREDFESRYVIEENLPAWLFEDFGAAPAEAAEASDSGKKRGGSLRERAGDRGGGRAKSAKRDSWDSFPDFPGPRLSSDATRTAKGLMDSIGSEDWTFEELMEAIEESLEEDDVHEVAADYLRASACFASDRIPEAIEAIAAVVAADSEHLPSVILQAAALRKAKDFKKALEVLYAAREKWPAINGVHSWLIYTEIMARHLETAQDLIRDPSVYRALGDEAKGLKSQIDKALSGPDWPRTYSFKSKHYWVQSDISEDICQDAAKMLESAYTSYSVRLKKVKGLEKERFRVYIFSGEAGYQRYTADSFGSKAENSAGVYSPFLKQLLIWNVPQKVDMFRTTVHEGFHQYLDAVSFGTPIWFNEGMAEYNERGEVVDGRWTVGQIREDHLDLLDRKGLMPLKDLIWMSTRRFQTKDVGLNYAQSWAFIHFLRNRGKEELAMFNDLFRGFTEQPAQYRTLQEVFGSTDWVELNQQFAEYLEELRAQL